MEKTILVDAWNTFVTRDGIFLEMKELLDSFSNKKIILTNANEEEKVKLGVLNMPYEVFTLSHNPDKVESNYYKKMLEHYSLTSSDVIYFEHNSDTIASAKSNGINTFHYDKDTKNIGELKLFLEKNLK